MTTLTPPNIWEHLTIDLDQLDLENSQLPPSYGKYYTADEDRPQMMRYFDAIMSAYGSDLLQNSLDFQLQGGKLVGTYCTHIPNDLIYAAGAMPMGLCSASNAAAIQGEQFVPVNVCPLVKASIGARMAKSCPYAAAADLLIGETSCDAKTKAWPIMQEDADMFVLQLPHRKLPEDFERYKDELYKMKDSLEELTGQTITRESLLTAINHLNARKSAIQRMWSYRKGDKIPISGKDCLIVQKASEYLAPAQFVELTERLCDELDERIANDQVLTNEDTPRILLTGSPIGMQDWYLNSLIEQAGGMVVAEETCASTRLYNRTVEVRDDSFDGLMTALARKYFDSIHCACFTPNPGRLEDLNQLIDDYQVDGVIDIHLSFCQIFDIEHYFVEQAMEKRQMPCIGLEVDYRDDDSGQMLTRIEAFLEMMQ